jgi:signal transduction histidine kinase
MTDAEKKTVVEQDISTLKPFRLVKFFSFTGLIVFLLSTIILVWLISNHTKKMLIEQSEGYARVLANNLNHQVFLQFVIPALRRYGKIAISNPDQFELLDTIVRNTTHGMQVQSVTIFDRVEGIVSYSTIPELVGKKGLGKSEYQKALEGKNNSDLNFSGSLVNLLPGTDAIFCELRTFIPFRQEKGPGQSTGPIMGVFEITQDLSDEFTALIRLQGVIIGTAVIIMSTLFVVLGLIVARADKIIEARAAERRKLEEKLNHAERLAGLGKMVASVSHEIKNPLGIVRSTAELLARRLRTVAPENEHLAKIIVDETGRLNGVVSEFLDFARPQKPKFTETSVNDLLRKVITFMEPEFKKTGIQLEDRMQEGLKPVMMDWEQMYRAFLNIFVNAIHAMPDGGVLSVFTGRSPRRGKFSMFIEIRDTGVGIEEEMREQIFQPFFTDKYRGTGLGLAIVKNIIDNHNGSIIVTSKKGEGTAFKIEL